MPKLQASAALSGSHVMVAGVDVRQSTRRPSAANPPIKGGCLWREGLRYVTGVVCAMFSLVHQRFLYGTFPSQLGHSGFAWQMESSGQRRRRHKAGGRVMMHAGFQTLVPSRAAKTRAPLPVLRRPPHRRGRQLHAGTPFFSAPRSFHLLCRQTWTNTRQMIEAVSGGRAG